MARDFRVKGLNLVFTSVMNRVIMMAGWLRRITESLAPLHHNHHSNEDNPGASDEIAAAGTRAINQLPAGKAYLVGTLTFNEFLTALGGGAALLVVAAGWLNSTLFWIVQL